MGGAGEHDVSGVSGVGTSATGAGDQYAADVEFADAELQEMETASAQIKILGERYPEALEKTTGL